MADYLARVVVAGARTTPTARPPVTGPPRLPPMSPEAVAPSEVPVTGDSGRFRKEAETPPASPVPRPSPKAEQPASVHMPGELPPGTSSPPAPPPLPAGDATTRVHMPKGLRPTTAPAHNHLPVGGMSAPRSAESPPTGRPASTVEGRPTVSSSFGLVEVSAAAHLAAETKSAAAVKVEQGVPRAIEVTKATEVSERPEAPPESRVAPRPPVGEEVAAPAVKVPDVGIADVERGRTEPARRDEAGPPLMIPRVPAAPAKMEGLQVRSEPQRARITIGRIDVQVQNQPVAPPAAAPLPLANLRPGDLLAQYYLDRFRLRL